MIPLCLITGFLGTGKTTLLKHIVEQNRDRKLIYLINEFSALDVDGAIVSKENPAVVSIPGGSIFCKCLVTEFIGQLSRIRDEHADAEGIIIEASGMADPRVIADMLKETHLDRDFSLARIVSIVEPRSFLRLIHTLPNIIHQVEAADLVLLNKSDLFDEEQLTQTELAVKEINPTVPLLRSIKGDVDFSLFNSEKEERSDLHGDYAKCRDPRYAAFSIELPHSINPEELKQFIEENEDAIYRAKGYINTPEGPRFFDYSSNGISLSEASPSSTFAMAWICPGDTVEHIEKAVRTRWA